MEGEKEDSSNFSIGNSAQERGMSHVPECYVLPQSQRPTLKNSEMENIPIVNLDGLHLSPSQRAVVVDDIRKACTQMGFFQIVNHGINQTVLDDALSAASDFFNLPNECKKEFMSNDVFKPIRYGTSLKDGLDKVQFWRVFLKHYAHPLKDWVQLWPRNPPNYREKMGKFSIEVRKVAMELMSAITESLGLGPAYLVEKMDDGMQVMAINCYPPCPQPDRALGLPPHTDYSCITILLQSRSGLQVRPSKDGPWINVPEIKGALQVLIGDHFEVLSNGLYKSVVHRAILNLNKTRFSIASLHSLGMKTKMETSKELIDDRHPKGYTESSFEDFLNFLCGNDIGDGKSFIDTHKIKHNIIVDY